MENFGEYSNVLESDFSNWEDDFFSQNSQFSDVENSFDSKNLIESLQSTTNKNISQTDGTSFCRDEIFRRGIIEALSCKEIKPPKFGKINTSRNYIPQKKLKLMDISSQEKNKQSARKNVHEISDSDDFCSPNKKYKRSKTSPKNIFSSSDNFTKRSFSIYSTKTCEKSLESIIGIQNLGASKSQSDIMTTSNPEYPSNQNAAVSSQESCSSKMITSSQEVSTSQKMCVSSQEVSTSQKMSTSSQETAPSQKMSTSSQETAPSQKMSTSSQETAPSQKMSTFSKETASSRKMRLSQEISTGQKMNTSSQEISINQKVSESRENTCKEMIVSSQENSGSQNIFSCSEICFSPKIISSSQESLGKQVMGISIEENASILNVTSHSSSETPVIIAPHEQKTNFQQPGILNQGRVNSETLNAYNHQISDNYKFSSKKLKTDFSDKNETEHFKSTISDSICNKTGRRCNKIEKRIIWGIRKRELEVTKRENTVEIREKQLDSREAEIQKREQILKAREQRYLRRKKASLKKLAKNSINISKISEEKTRCLRR